MALQVSTSQVVKAPRPVVKAVKLAPNRHPLPTNAQRGNVHEMCCVDNSTVPGLQLQGMKGLSKSDQQTCDMAHLAHPLPQWSPCWHTEPCSQQAAWLPYATINVGHGLCTCCQPQSIACRHARSLSMPIASDKTVANIRRCSSSRLSVTASLRAGGRFTTKP